MSCCESWMRSVQYVIYVIKIPLSFCLINALNLFTSLDFLFVSRCRKTISILNSVTRKTSATNVNQTSHIRIISVPQGRVVRCCWGGQQASHAGFRMRGALSSHLPLSSLCQPHRLPSSLSTQLLFRLPRGSSAACPTDEHDLDRRKRVCYTYAAS